MSYEEGKNSFTMNAATKNILQYTFVQVSTAGKDYVKKGALQASSSTRVFPVGVTQNAPVGTYEALEIAGPGSITKLVCSSTKLGYGSRIIVGASGAAASTASVTDKHPLVGVWLSAAAAVNSIGTALFWPYGIST